MTLTDLIEKWRSENRAYCMEGTSGVRHLQKLCEDIGYKDGQFVGYNVALLNFLADNSGVIDAIIEWIGDQEIEDWKENIRGNLREPPDEDEEREA
jgi:hypothetical protein